MEGEDPNEDSKFSKNCNVLLILIGQRCAKLKELEFSDWPFSDIIGLES